MQNAPESALSLYVFQDEKQLGPFSLTAVRAMMSSSSLNSSAVVWHEGMGDWQPIDKFLAAHPLPQAASPRPTPSPRPMRSVADYPGMTAPQRQQQSSQPSDVSRVMRSVIAGSVAAVVGGGAWLGLILVAKWQSGLLAWGVGALCGWSVSYFGRGNGVVFQVIAVGCSLLGIAIGKLGVLLIYGVVLLSPWDIIGVILAVLSAWKTAGGGDD